MRGTTRGAEADVDDEPEQRRDRQSSRPGQQHERADDVDDDVPDGVDARHDASRTAGPVCIIRLAMRPAKSFWKKVQLWRITCQWLCQRIRLVTPGSTALLRTRLSASSASGRPTSTSTAIASRLGIASCSAAARSVDSISATRRPMKTGISVSINATTRPVANIAANRPAPGARNARRTPAARPAAPWRARRWGGCAARRSGTGGGVRHRQIVAAVLPRRANGGGCEPAARVRRCSRPSPRRLRPHR